MSDTYLPGDTRQRIQDLIKSKKITPQPVSPGADNEPGRWFHHPDRQIL